MGKASRRKQETTLASAPVAAGAPESAAAARPRLPRARPAWPALLLGPLAIVALGWALYANSLAIPFLFDDYLEIETNPAVREVQPLGSYVTRLRGLTQLTFALNVRAGGFAVTGFHVVNVAVHVANALLVWALVLWTLRRPIFAGRYGARAPWLATLVALVFVAHPLQTMVASYLSQRAEGLGGFFYLLALLSAAVGLAAAAALPRAAWLTAALLCALFGIVSKEIVATVPIAVALYWQCFLAGERRLSWARRLAALALLALPLAYGLVLARTYLFPSAGAPDVLAGPRAWLFIPTAGFGLSGVTPWQYLLTQFGVVTWYLRLFALPSGQVFDYGWPLVDGLWRADVLAPLAFLLAVLAAAVLAYRRYRLASFCLGFVFITLAPTSTIIPLRDAAFEHRMYLPVIGLAWLVVVGADDLLTWLAARGAAAPRQLRAAGAALALLWVALLGTATVRRNAVFADPFARAEDNARQAPDHWRAQYQYGDALLKRERADEALAAFETAVRLNGDQGSARIALGGQYLRRQRYTDAVRVLEPAVEHPEESVVAAALQNLGSAYQGTGELDRAADALLRAIAIKPAWATLRRQLAELYVRKKYWLGAARFYNEAIELSPRLRAALARPAADANFRAGVQLEGEGAFPFAIKRFEVALDLEPGLTPARRRLAYTAARAGDWSLARTTLERLAREQPGDAWVNASLASARVEQPLTHP